MIRNMLRAITEKCHLNAITLGEFTKMKVGGMNFEIWAFHADGLGHVSAVTASGFLGLVKMDTLIINPTERDMPLFSCHRGRAMDGDTLICQVCDTILERADLEGLEAVRARYRQLPDHDPGARWYDSLKLPVSLSKQGKKSHRADFDRCAMEYLEAFLKAAEDAPYCDPAAKKEKASVYVEGLLTNSGPSADVFLKGIGEEKTGELFRRFLFGTQR